MLQMGYGLECMPNDNIPTKLFCGRLPLGTTSGELTEVFKKYGPLKDVYIPPQAKGELVISHFNILSRIQFFPVAMRF